MAKVYDSKIQYMTNREREGTGKVHGGEIHVSRFFFDEYCMRMPSLQLQMAGTDGLQKHLCTLEIL